MVDFDPDLMKMPQHRYDDIWDEMRDVSAEMSNDAASRPGPSDPGFPGSRADDLQDNIRLLIEKQLPKAMEYLEAGKNIEFIDIPDISKLAQETQEKISQHLLQAQTFNLAAALSVPLQQLKHTLPAFFSHFSKLLPDLDKELARLKRSRLESGDGKMSVLEKQFHKLRQYASELCQHILNVFNLLDTVKDNPTHFTPWERWQGSERSSRRSALFVEEYGKGHANNYLSQFNGKTSGERRDLMQADPKLAGLLKMNALMNLASWEERSTRQRLVPALLISANKLQTAIPLTQQSAINLAETVWVTGGTRGLYTPGNNTLEGRAYLLAKMIEQVCAGLGILTDMLMQAKNALPPDTLLQEYGDDTGVLSSAAQEAKTQARVWYEDPLPGVIKKPRDAGSKFYNKIIYRGGFTPLMPQQQQAMLRVGIILSDRLQHLRHNLTALERDSLLLQQARERKAVADKLPDNPLFSTTLDSALVNAPALWQKNIEQKRADLQTGLGRMRALPVKNERRRFLSELQNILGLKPRNPALPESVSEFGDLIERCVNGMGEIEDAMAEQTGDMPGNPGKINHDFRVSLAKWRVELEHYNASLKTSMAKYTGRSTGNANRSTMIAKALAEHLGEYKREFLQTLSPTERKEAGVFFDTSVSGIMADYMPLLAKKNDWQGVRFLQRFETEMNNAQQSYIIYPTRMTEILSGMKSTDGRMRDWALKQLVGRGFFRHLIRGVSLIPNLLSLPLRLAFRITVKSTMTAVIIVNTTRTANKGIRVGQGGAGGANRAFVEQLIKEGALKTLLSAIPGLALMAGFRAVQLELDDGKSPINIALDRLRDTPRELPWQLLDWTMRESMGALQDGSARAAFRELIETLYGDENSPSAQKQPEGSEKLTVGNELQRMASENPELAGLAQRLAEIPSEAQNVSIWQSDEPGHSYYNLKDRSIRFGAGATDQQKLHEIAHAMTAHQLRHGQENPTSRLGKQVDKLDKLRLQAAGSYTGNDPFVKYYLGTLDEFVAGLYSGNERFVAHLKSITAEGESLLSRAVRIVRQLLGIAEESNNALLAAMRLTDALMGTPLAEGEGDDEGQLYSAGDTGHQPELAPRTQTLPNTRKVGGFIKWQTIPDGIPAGFQVQLIITHKDNKINRIVIPVPDQYRPQYRWQQYVAQQINLTPGLYGIKIGDKDDSVVITPIGSRHRNIFYVDEGSSIDRIGWSFISNNASNDPESTKRDVMLGYLGNRFGLPTLNRETKIQIEIVDYDSSGQEILFSKEGDEFDINLDTLLSKDESEWSDQYNKYLNPKVNILWPDSLPAGLRQNLRDPNFIKAYSLKKNASVTPLQNKLPQPSQQNPQTAEQTRPAQTRPAQTRPAQTRPVQTTPVQTAPAQTAPVQTTPVQTAPVQTTPAQNTPTIENTETDIDRPVEQARSLADYDHDISYQSFSDDQKQQTYLHGIKFILNKIRFDSRIPKNIRDNAYLATIGVKKLIPVDLGGFKLNNTVFLPDSQGSKTGIIIKLDSEIPYYYVKQGSDILENVKWAMPYDANVKKRVRTYDVKTQASIIITLPTGMDRLNGIRNGTLSFNRYFNSDNPQSMDIATLSKYVANTMEADYKSKGETIVNKILISRAIAGAHIPDPGVTATEVKSRLELTTADLAPKDYLRSFARPFSALGGEMQLIFSSIQGETIQDTELHVHQAEYIGSWIDATAGAITSFTPEGWILSSAQSAADIAADLTEGKHPDPLAVAGLVLGWIPGEKIAAKVGKFTALGGNAVKYGLMLGNKTVDLAIMGKSIKTAVETGDPLAIYQALLASGMSVENSYRMTVHMSSKLNITEKISGSDRLDNSTQNGTQARVDPDNLGSTTQESSAPDESSGPTQDIIFAGPSIPTRRENFDYVSNHRIRLNPLLKLTFRGMFAGTRIEAFDNESSKYKKSNEFALAHVSVLDKKFTKKISTELLTSSLNDMEIKTNSLVNQLESYRGNAKESIVKNIEVINTLLENMKEKVKNSNDLTTETYVLTGKDLAPDNISNHYGLAEVKFSVNTSDVSINSLIAHPYVVVNKYPAFKEFLIKEGYISRSELEKYNIRNVGRYLGSKAIRNEIDYYESIPSVKVKSFSFDAANPITQRFGNQFERLSNFLRINKSPEEVFFENHEDEFYEDQGDENTVLQNMINDLKSKVRKEFAPVRLIREMSAAKTEEAIAQIMNEGEAQIIANDITDSNISDVKVKEYSREVTAAVDRAYEKVNSVKLLFERAGSQPEIKEAFKTLLDQASGLNDEVMIDIDDMDVSNISDMVYNRFKNNIDALHDFLSKQKNEGYNSFVLFKYNQFNSSKPDAYALPYDSKKRILLAMLPENQRHGGLVDTVIHEASHNASYTLDHTYVGNIRTETGSFLAAFDFSARDPKNFYNTERTRQLSTKYALGLPDNALVTMEHETQAKLILENSRLVKSDTLLNAAEYNAYMIDVLSQAEVKGSSIELPNKPSRTRREVSATGHEHDSIIMLASLKAVLPGH